LLEIFLLEWRASEVRRVCLNACRHRCANYPQ
jgi:hypothetical protein